MSRSDQDPPVRVYTPGSPLLKPAVLLAEMSSDLRASRELAWRLTVRDFKALYRQSYAGYLWAFLPPLFAAATFILLQSGEVVDFGDTSIPYPAFVMIGTVLWQVFVDALNNPLRVMQSSRQMLVKVNFPREALVLSAFQTTAIGLAIRMSILLPVWLWFRFPVSAWTLLFPVGLAAIMLLGVTIGLFLATIGMIYQDVSRGLLLITNLWMFLTPVVFSGVRDGVVGAIMNINPVTHVLVATRDWFTGVPTAGGGGFCIVFGLSLAGLLLAWLIYRLFLPRVIERLGM